MSLSLTLAPTLSISLSLLAPLGSLTLYASLCCLKKLFVVFSVAFCCFPTLEQLWFDFGLFAWVLLLLLLMPDFEHEWACCCSLWHTVCVGETNNDQDIDKVGSTQYFSSYIDINIYNYFTKSTIRVTVIIFCFHHGIRTKDRRAFKIWRPP